MRETLSLIFVAAALGVSMGASSQTMNGFHKPGQQSVVKAQADYALIQLKVLSGFMGSDPSGLASREAIEKGWAPVNRGFASPSHGWPARGASLGESIEPLLAQARAGAQGCKELEGACQKSAQNWAKEGMSRIKHAKNPGVEFAKVVDLVEKALEN